MSELTELKSLADSIRRDQGSRWRAGQRRFIEDYLAEHPQLESDPELLLDLIFNEYCLRKDLKLGAEPEEYLERFPRFAADLSRLFEVDDALDTGQGAGQKETTTHLPLSQKSDVAANGSSETPFPETIGRYDITGVLGSGGFAVVYRATDKELGRDVAIKVPPSKWFDSPHRLELYRAEARTLASLDHPHIVPVYDVGSTDQHPCFVVSKLIEGSDLANRMRSRPLSIEESVTLTAAIADALHHAHLKGLVHRDVKPANILLDAVDRPFLADFGLALQDRDLGKDSGFLGTPAYMSPEQARGEGHRVDGRSDIFSLGIVLYELLTGKRPFRSDDPAELLRQISSMDARPLRQVVDAIPRELERICLKALEKSVSARYATARDFAEDLRRLAASLASAADSRLPLAAETPSGSRCSSTDRMMEQTSLRGFWLWASLIGVALVMSLAVVLGSWKRNRSDAQHGSDSLSNETAALSPVQVASFDILVSRQGRALLPIEQLAPLCRGDSVHVSVRLSRPAYARLLWIDAGGVAAELYPRDPELGLRGTEPITELESPSQLDRGWPLEIVGTREMAVLLVSNQPLPDTTFQGVPETLTQEPTQLARYTASRDEPAVLFAMATRSLKTESQRIDDPVRQMLEQLRKQCDLLQACCIPIEPAPKKE